MKLSRETVALMKNFAAINGNLLIKPGNVLSTISAAKSVYATTTVKEEFEHQFGIYDLNEFLGVLSLFEDPDLDFSEKFVTVKQGRTSLKYFSADESVLTAPSKQIKTPPADIEFKLTTDQVNMIIKTAGVLRAPDVTIRGDGTDLMIVVGDKKNPTGNNYEMVVDQTSDTFQAHIRIDNFKVIPGEYQVEIAAQKICSFKAGQLQYVPGQLQYVLSLEADSQF